MLVSSGLKMNAFISQVGDVIVSVGPDLLTSCGNPTNILSVNETYVVGIGGPCSFYNEWTAYSRYSTADLELLANNCINEVTPSPTPTSRVDDNDSSAKSIFPPNLMVLMAAVMLLLYF